MGNYWIQEHAVAPLRIEFFTENPNLCEEMGTGKKRNMRRNLHWPLEARFTTILKELVK
jgi:hypothetical protein